MFFITLFFLFKKKLYLYRRKESETANTWYIAFFVYAHASLKVLFTMVEIPKEHPNKKQDQNCTHRGEYLGSMNCI